MATPGADWREITDRYRTDTPESACPGRPELGFGSAASRCSVDGIGRIAAGTYVENPGNSGNGDGRSTVETDDNTGVEPLAIGGSNRRVGVTERPVFGIFDGDIAEIGGRSGTCFGGVGSVFTTFRFGASVGGDRYMIDDRQPERTICRGSTTGTTVITK